jgi:hypothetical protein
MSRRPKIWSLVANVIANVIANWGALGAAHAFAAPTALGFADGRAGQSLDGAWHVIVDP